jgi:hypothetical protein
VSIVIAVLPFVAAVIVPPEELTVTLDVPLVIAVGDEEIVVHVGATPEPPEVNACPAVPDAPVKVNAVVKLSDAMVGAVPNTLAPVPVIVVVEM